MKVAVVAYPTLDDGDRAWIESIRRAHDPQAARIAVHFTLVFPVDSSTDLDSELSAAAVSTKPISFVSRRTKSVVDVVMGGVQVFLVPDEGTDQIAQLHDRLYAGTLHKHLRRDIPYVPHMTIATGPDVASCERLAQRLGSRIISGEIDRFELVDVSQPQVTSLRTYAMNP